MNIKIHPVAYLGKNINVMTGGMRAMALVTFLQLQSLALYMTMGYIPLKFSY